METAVNMAIQINNNAHLFSISRLNSTQNTLQTATERLSSGKRINRAADDAAGLAIAAQMATQILGSQTAYRNTNDGISLVQTAEGALSEVSEINQRIRELAVQSSNGILNDDDRAALQAEVTQLQEQVSQIFSTTEFNGQAILGDNTTVELQVGNEAGDQVSINTTDLNAELTSLGFFSVDVSTANGAQTALSALDATADTLNRSRSDFGAISNRLESIGRSLEVETENLAASRSRIEDADIAAEVATQTSSLILQNAGLASLTQANVSNTLVERLLK